MHDDDVGDDDLMSVELRAFPRGVARRKDTVMVGNSARLDCPYPHRSSGAADAARLRFHWSRVTSEHDHSPVRIISDDRHVVGFDGKHFSVTQF